VFTVAAVQGADSRIYETARCLGRVRCARWDHAVGGALRGDGGFVNAFGRVVSEVGCALLVAATSPA